MIQSGAAGPPSVRITVLGASEDWGGALPSDIAAVTQSVARCFVDALAERPMRDILVEPTPSSGDAPVTLWSPAADGSTRILLPVRGNLWARMVYQFAHELCHALVGTHPGRGADWLEETLCEVGSLFALGATAHSWARRAPYPGWTPYATELARYRGARIAEPAHRLPANRSFFAWFRETLPQLEANATARRDYNTMVAVRVLGIFDRVPAAWRTVRYLNSWQRESAVAARDVSGLLAHWRAATPARLRHFVDIFERRLVQRELRANGAGVLQGQRSPAGPALETGSGALDREEGLVEPESPSTGVKNRPAL